MNMINIIEYFDYVMDSKLEKPCLIEKLADFQYLIYLLNMAGFERNHDQPSGNRPEEESYAYKFKRRTDAARIILEVVPCAYSNRSGAIDFEMYGYFERSASSFSYKTVGLVEALGQVHGFK